MRTIIMLANRILSLATAALLALSSTQAFAQSAARAPAPFAVSPEVVRTCADVERNPRSAKACATALRNSIAASSEDMAALKKAAKQTDPAAKSLVIPHILERHGLTAVQLQGATLNLSSVTGAADARLRDIEIEISCCPLTITITIRF